MTSLSRTVNAWIVSRTLFSFQCYDLGARSWIVPSQVLTEAARMLRFLTPTEAWRGRVASKVSLPGEWPVMLVEILHTDDGQISMTCALGVPKSSLKAFFAQGAYLYEFQELPAAIVGILDAHFAQVEKDLANKMDSLAPTFKPKLILIKR
jgi:hypothetical protein